MSFERQIFDIWVVAAAVLCVEGGSLHIEDLTERVLRSGLTILGLKGKTPRQSVSPLINQRRHVFSRLGGGCYNVVGPHIANHPSVAAAIRSLQQ